MVVLGDELKTNSKRIHSYGAYRTLYRLRYYMILGAMGVDQGYNYRPDLWYSFLLLKTLIPCRNKRNLRKVLTYIGMDVHNQCSSHRLLSHNSS